MNMKNAPPAFAALMWLVRAMAPPALARRALPLAAALNLHIHHAAGEAVLAQLSRSEHSNEVAAAMKLLRCNCGWLVCYLRVQADGGLG